MAIPSNLLPKKIERGFDGYALSHRVLRTEPGLPPEFVMDPDFWQHLAARCRVHDQILVIAQDGSFEADLRVMSIDPDGHWAQMRLLREWPAGVISAAVKDAPAPPEPLARGPDADGYLIEWSGPQRWRIVRGADVVATDLPDEAAAAMTLANIKAAKPSKRAAA